MNSVPILGRIEISLRHIFENHRGRTVYPLRKESLGYVKNLLCFVPVSLQIVCKALFIKTEKLLGEHLPHIEDLVLEEQIWGFSFFGKNHLLKLLDLHFFTVVSGFLLNSSVFLLWMFWYLEPGCIQVNCIKCNGILASFYSDHVNSS